MARSQTLHCIVCTGRIPEGRDRRQTATCSEKCKNQLDEIRAAQRAEKRCPACLHPATPEEREEFRLWRAQRPKDGSTRLNVRIPYAEPRDGSTASRRELARGLKQSLDLLDGLLVAAFECLSRAGEEQDPLFDAFSPVAEKVQGWRKLLTPPPAKPVDSAPSGITATESEHESLG